jgi:hypothetical protein
MKVAIKKLKIESQKTMEMKFDITKTKLCILIDSNNLTRLVNIEEIEEQESPINIHTLRGSVPVFEGKHGSICSNSDVTIEFRSMPKKCGKDCCDL